MMLDAHGGTVKVAFWIFGFAEGVFVLDQILELLCEAR